MTHYPHAQSSKISMLPGNRSQSSVTALPHFTTTTSADVNPVFFLRWRVSMSPELPFFRTLLNYCASRLTWLTLGKATGSQYGSVLQQWWNIAWVQRFTKNRVGHTSTLQKVISQRTNCYCSVGNCGRRAHAKCRTGSQPMFRMKLVTDILVKTGEMVTMI